MSDSLEPLILDLLEFVAVKPRRYSDVMDAWRTSCPRVPVWEEATGRGMVERRSGDNGTIVTLTDSGSAFLNQHRNAALPGSAPAIT